MLPGPGEAGNKALDLETGSGAQSSRKAGLVGARSRVFGPIAGVGKMHLQVTGLEEVPREAAGRNCQCRYTDGAVGSDRPEIDSQAACKFDRRQLGRADMMEQTAAAATDIDDAAPAAGHHRSGWEKVGKLAHHLIDRVGKMERMVVAAGAAVG